MIRRLLYAYIHAGNIMVDAASDMARMPLVPATLALALLGNDNKEDTCGCTDCSALSP